MVKNTHAWKNGTIFSHDTHGVRVLNNSNFQALSQGENCFRKDSCPGNFPGSAVVKTLPSDAGSSDSISGWEAKIPHAPRAKY